ncbi:MAG: DUF1592 domain-containing protein [Limisphaerales bacterium]
MNRLLRKTIFIICLLLFCFSASAFFGRKQAQSAPPATVSFDSEIKPLISEYCLDCHNDRRRRADLSLEMFHTEADAMKNRAVWEKVLHNIQSGEMPPKSKPQPTLEERETITEWIQDRLLRADCSNPDPGRVTIRRLNRTEYNNTIRDLVGINFQPAADFPADDTGYGFDNIGDVLSLPPVLFERYMAAAEKILDAAIVSDPNSEGPTRRVLATRMRTTGPGNGVRTNAFKMTKEGEMFASVEFPKAGDYTIRVRAWGERGGNELPKMELKVDDSVVQTFDVEAIEKEPGTYETSIQVGIGEKKISVAYINNFSDEKFHDPKRRDRNLIVNWIEVVGPRAPSVLPATHTRIFKKPSKPKLDQQAHAREIIHDFAKRAFRRPLRAEEMNRLVRFYDMAQAEGENFESSVKLALQAVLVSPHFLFRGEAQPDPNNPDSIHFIDEFALASRLSYFLWSSMPDDELFALAEKKRLRRNLQIQVKRMLRDPKSSAFVQNFIGQWLQVRNLEFVRPDKHEYPEFDEALRLAMRRETELLFEHILKQDRSVVELISANYSFLNERLARHYGIEGLEGNEFQRVSFKNSPRGGILTHGSFLTLTSNPTRTSPVKRGKYVLENILGTPPPPPPPEVPELEEVKEAATGTLRQRMEQHRDDPNCASCHARMDPIGFGLENFDGIGAWRSKEGEFEIDASGELVSGESFDGVAELKRILAEQKKDEFTRCLSEKMLTYGLGRGLEFYDKCAVDEVTKKVRKENYKFSSLIQAIVESTPFQKRRGENRSD